MSRAGCWAPLSLSWGGQAVPQPLVLLGQRGEWWHWKPCCGCWEVLGSVWMSGMRAHQGQATSGGKEGAGTGGCLLAALLLALYFIFPPALVFECWFHICLVCSVANKFSCSYSLLLFLFALERHRAAGSLSLSLTLWTSLALASHKPGAGSMPWGSQALPPRTSLALPFPASAGAGPGAPHARLAVGCCV